MWLIVGSFYPIFGIAIPVFTWPMVLLVSLFTLACLCIGMLFSLAVPSQRKATELLMVLATPSFLLSGYTWPIEAMPRLIQQFSNLLPLTHFLQAFWRIAIYRGTVNDIHPQLMALTWTSIVCFLLMVILLQVKISRQRKHLVLAK